MLLAGAAALAVGAFALAQPAPVTWCGTDEVAATRTPDLEPTSKAQVRFMYAVPSDGTDRFSALASEIANDAAWIDQWWQGQDPTRTPRFARFAFPGCTTKFGELDIGFARLPHPAADYLVDDTPTVQIENDLASSAPARQKTIVYYDGPLKNTGVCGEAPATIDGGGADGIGVVYLQSACFRSSDVGTALVAAHELIHDLGAVPDAAPHACNNGHVCDAATDLMQATASTSSLDKTALDVGRDDYYGHSGSWWDVQDSSWLSHLPQFALSTGASGGGSLQIQAGDADVQCADATCAPLTLDNGTSITIDASPDPGHALTGWTGACAGSPEECTFTLSQSESVTATFALLQTRVAVKLVGRGKVTSAPAGISCGRACSHTFSGTGAVLRATPAKGWRFAGWSGACRGVGACRFTAGTGGSARAKFVKK